MQPTKRVESNLVKKEDEKVNYKIRTGIAVALTILLAPVVELPAQAQTTQRTEPRTVVDYFLLAPDVYLDGSDRWLREEMVRNGWLNIVDVKNGYILYDASDNPSGFEFAIFRKSNGSYLVAYSDGIFSDPEFSAELGKEPDSRLFLLSYEAGRWHDVTKSVLPVKFDKRLVYKLPRRGRSIEVTDMQGRKLYTLTWRNDRFHLN